MREMLLLLGLLIPSIICADTNQSSPSEPASVSTPRLSIINVRNLSFPAAFQGDPAETVAPSSSDSSDAALFLLQGRPYAAVIILIPDDVIVLKTSSREPGSKTLMVKRLRSRPEAGHSFQLSARGISSVSVGGTREAVAKNQASGDYEGRFFVTVMYQ